MFQGETDTACAARGVNVNEVFQRFELGPEGDGPGEAQGLGDLADVLRAQVLTETFAVLTEDDRGQVPDRIVGHDRDLLQPTARLGEAGGAQARLGVFGCVEVRDLLDAGQQVVRVPAKLMAQARSSARTRGKSDPIDALAVARAVLRSPWPTRCCLRRASDRE